MRRSTLAFALLFALVTSCGGSPPPEGFEIQMGFLSVDPSVIEELRVSIVPETPGSFAMIEPMQFADGAIDLDVATDGVVEITVDGEYVAANSAPNASGTLVFPLEVWTADQMPRSPEPQVRVVARRAGDPIAEGRFIRLPQWPLPEGGSVFVQVACLSDAANLGLCLP